MTGFVHSQYQVIAMGNLGKVIDDIYKCEYDDALESLDEVRETIVGMIEDAG